MIIKKQEMLLTLSSTYEILLEINSIILIEYFKEENIKFSGPVDLYIKDGKFFSIIHSSNVYEDLNTKNYSTYKKFFCIENIDYQKIRKLVSDEIKIELKIID